MEFHSFLLCAFASLREKFSWQGVSIAFDPAPYTRAASPPPWAAHAFKPPALPEVPDFSHKGISTDCHEGYNMFASKILFSRQPGRHEMSGSPAVVVDPSRES
jgi:hypothetical protein